MRRLYTLGLALYLVAQMPGFLAAGLLRGKYDLRRRLREGFLGPQLPPAAESQAVWVHACSLGEVLAARALIAGLRERLPGRRLVVSTITRTGFDIARARLSGLVDGVFYFPFDLPGAVRRALDSVRPAAVVIVETEIWPNFLAECHRRAIPVAWVNGRVSDRAFSRYRFGRPLLTPLLRAARLFVMRSEEDARRIRSMGAPEGRVVVAGNLKYDREPAAGQGKQPSAAEAARGLDALLGLSGGGPLIVAGSTTEPEEEIVLAAFELVRRHPNLSGARLLIAPRHPERFEEVAAMLEATGHRFARRSHPEPGGGAEVILLDSIGELAATYALASAVFVGGSFARRGGQSILEPAAHARSAVVGPHMENFRDVLADFAAADAVVQISEEEPQAAARLLADAWVRMLTRPEETRQMGLRAQAVLAKGSGATARTLAHLLPVLEESLSPAA
jgi:3-deoxy-D-manno-octulosonic-acid transferase